MTGDRFQFTITVLVGLAAPALPYGFLVGLVVGTFLAHTARASAGFAAGAGAGGSI
jgi:hypothetical protein